MSTTKGLASVAISAARDVRLGPKKVDSRDGPEGVPIRSDLTHKPVTRKFSVNFLYLHTLQQKMKILFLGQVVVGVNLVERLLPTPGTDPIKILQHEFYATQFFQDFD